MSRRPDVAPFPFGIRRGRLPRRPLRPTGPAWSAGLRDRGRVELLAGGALVECVQFVGRERSLDRVNRLDGLRIEAV